MLESPYSLGMAPLSPTRPLTVEDLYSKPDDGFKYELEAGRLVREPLPGARHGRVVARLTRLLDEFAERHRLGVVVAGDPGFILSRGPDTVRGPDVAFVSRVRFERVGDVASAFPEAPDLAVEVLSPSNTPAAVHGKVADYLAAGTRLVWVVDPATRTVAAYRSLLAPRVFGEDEKLDAGDVLPGFGPRVGELFEV